MRCITTLRKLPTIRPNRAATRVTNRLPGAANSRVSCSMVVWSEEVVPRRHCLALPQCKTSASVWGCFQALEPWISKLAVMFFISGDPELHAPASPGQHIDQRVDGELGRFFVDHVGNTGAADAQYLRGVGLFQV